MKNLFLVLAFILTSSFVFAEEKIIEENESIEEVNYQSLAVSMNSAYLLILEYGVLCVVSQTVPVATVGMVTYYDTIYYVQWASSDDHCDLINTMVGQGMGSSGN